MFGESVFVVQVILFTYAYLKLIENAFVLAIAIMLIAYMLSVLERLEKPQPKTT